MLILASMATSMLSISISGIAAAKNLDNCVMTTSISDHKEFHRGTQVALVNRDGDWRISKPGLTCKDAFSTEWKKVYFTHTNEDGKEFYWAFKKSRKPVFSSTRTDVIKHFGAIVKLDLLA